MIMFIMFITILFSPFTAFMNNPIQSPTPHIIVILSMSVMVVFGTENCPYCATTAECWSQCSSWTRYSAGDITWILCNAICAGLSPSRCAVRKDGKCRCCAPESCVLPTPFPTPAPTKSPTEYLLATIFSRGDSPSPHSYISVDP
eukprot:230876_1